MITELNKIYKTNLLDDAIENSRSILTKSYLSELENAEIIPVKRELTDDDFSDLTILDEDELDDEN